MEVLAYFSSFLMGVTLGLLGGGGSILTVPIMVYLFHLPPSEATGHSLFVVGLTALIGAALAIRKGDVDFRAALAFAVPSVIGVNISRGVIMPSIPEIIYRHGSATLTKDALIMATFAILMLLASTSMIRKRQNAAPMKAPATTLRLGLQGLLVGLIAGFVGAGGGFLIIPALVLMAGLQMRVAIGTSLTVIAIQSLLGFGGDVARGAKIDWWLLLSVATAAALGIVVGSRFVHKIKEQTLKIAFGWFVLIMGLFILIEQTSRLANN